MRSTDPSYHYRISYKESGIVWKLSSYFTAHIPFTEPVVFYCIGTDRSTGDALGPLVGSYLSDLTYFPHPVVGTLEEPLHALNLRERIGQMRELHPAAMTVAIDACLGSPGAIGDILFHDGPTLPGKAVGKKLPAIGDTSIKGIVNMAGFMEQAVLQSTRLHVPFEMSRIIGRALQLAHHRQTSKHIYDRSDNADDRNSWNEVRYPDFRQAD